MIYNLQLQNYKKSLKIAHFFAALCIFISYLLMNKPKLAYKNP